MTPIHHRTAARMAAAGFLLLLTARPAANEQRQLFSHLRHRAERGARQQDLRRQLRQSASFVDDEEFLSALPPAVEGAVTASFVGENNTVVEVRDGESALLDCKVYLRHDKMVSWLRRRSDSLELLTVGDATYSGDRRINVSYSYPNNWRLNLTDVGKSDAGLYVCQISTFPPKAMVTTLRVRDALVEVVDSSGATLDRQMYYNPGSEIELACVVRSREEWSGDVVWVKDGQPLDLNHRPTVSIGTQVEAAHVLSRLWIGGASGSDSGNYTCTVPGRDPEEFPRARVRVHVVDGQFHAAVHGDASSAVPSGILSLLPLLSVVVSVASADEKRCSS